MATFQSIFTLRDDFSYRMEKITNSVNRSQEASVKLSTIFRGLSIAALAATAAVGALVPATDAYVNTFARLNLMNDGLQTTRVLQDEIYQAAQRSRTEFGAMTDVVARLGTLAGHSFGNTKEIVAFAETMNKQFAIGGASIQEQANAMYQLTQAMASNRLQGDEYRSILENAPLLAQSIAKSMGVGLGALKQLSSDGEITGEVIKKALLEATDEINEKFGKLPITFASAWTMAGNTVKKSLQPILVAISGASNNKGLQDSLIAIEVPLTRIAHIAGTLVTGAIQQIKNGFDTMSQIVDNAGRAFNGLVIMVQALAKIAFPALTGILATFISYMALTNLYLLAQRAYAIANAIAIGIWAQVISTMVVLQNLWKLGIFSVIAAQTIFNGIMATTVFIKGLWASATVGVSVVLGVLQGIIMALSSPILLVVALILGLIAAFAATSLEGKSLGDILADVFEGIVDMTEKMVNASISMLNFLIRGWNAAANAAANFAGTQYKAVQEITFKADYQGFKKKWGDSIRNGNVMQDITSAMQISMPDGDAYGRQGSADSENLDKTAKNTKGIKDALEIAAEDLKYLNDIADQKRIESYRNIEIKVDMSKMQNNITKEADGLDIAKILVSGIKDQLAVSGEGV